jgi:prolipoprotein diacylglyceryl transferase
MILALWLWSRKYKRPFLWILDRMAVAGALTGTCIRIGNFFNSEIVGVPTDLPWGVKFINLVPEGTPVERIIPLHPAQLYEALSYLLIFAVMIIIYYKKYPDLKPGLLIGILFVLVFIARFLIEFVKKDQVDFEAGMALNMGQILSIPFILLGLFMIFWKFKTPVKK